MGKDYDELLAGLIMNVEKRTQGQFYALGPSDYETNSMWITFQCFQTLKWVAERGMLPDSFHLSRNEPNVLIVNYLSGVWVNAQT